MNIWFNAIARAGGIDVAPSTGSTSAGPSQAHRNGPTLARRFLADTSGASPQALVGRVLRLVQSLNTRRRRRAVARERRAEVRELNALSDHILKDIGLRRGEIRSVVDEMIHDAAATPGDSPVEKKQARRLPLTGALFGAQPYPIQSAPPHTPERA